MSGFFKTIDEVLRGRRTRKEDLAEGKIDVPIRTLVLAGLLLGGAYGIFMGLFATMRATNASYEQLLATILKVPLLFILTLVVTYPSLYVVSALFDSRLRHGATLRLLLMGVTANLALLAGLGPVTGFFTFSTESYPFMIILNVAFFIVSGLVGLGFLRTALNAVFEVKEEPRENPTDLSESSARESLRPRPKKLASLRVFTFWILIYGCVGAQMGWVLRPFIGTPGLPFELFRSERESNFFEAFFKAIGQLFV